MSSFLSVGFSGKGLLRIEDGGHVTNTHGGVGGVFREEGEEGEELEELVIDGLGDGTVVVTGEGSLWEISEELAIGINAKGDLSVLDGGSVTNYEAYVGLDVGSIGTVLVSGAGSNWTNAYVFSVGYQGSGTLTINDGGTVTGIAAYLGEFESGTGTINIGAASGEAAAAVGKLDVPRILFGNGTGTLVFNHTDLTETFDAAFYFQSVGPGTHHILHEAGWTKFSGDSTDFDGTTEIDGGTLSVDGTLGGFVNVNDGGRLEGIGSLLELLNVYSGGTFAPGNSIGTKNVGDVVFNTGSIYEVEIDDEGNSDLINASGTAKLNGGTVKPSGTTGEGLEYTILTAAGGVTGTFDGAQRTLLNQYVLSYDANNVYLATDPLYDSICDVTSTANQASLACTVLDNLPDTNEVLQAVLALTSDEAGRDAFNALTGEFHPSMTGALMDNSQRRVEAVFERFRRAGNQSGGELPALGYANTGATYGLGHSDASTAAFGDLSSAADDQTGFWIAGHNIWSDTNATTNTAQMDNELQGVVIGLDRDAGENWLFGITGALSQTEVNQDTLASSGTADSYSLGAYGGYDNGPDNLSFGGFYNWHQIDSSRRIAFGGIDQTLTADYNARSWQAFAEASYEIQAGDVILQPLASASYIGIDTDGFSETGGSAALTAASSEEQTVFTTAGLRASMDFGDVKAQAMLGWRHVFGDTISSSTFTLAGSSAFTVDGAPIDEDSVITKIGFEATLSDSVSIGAAYTGQFGTDNTTHGAKGMVRMQF